MTKPRFKPFWAKTKRRYSPGQMNDLESSYAEHLDQLKQAGEIVWWGYEVFRMKLADKTSYTPDFIVVTADGHIEVHETKGRWMDDARVKIKVAAERYWFLKFYGIQKIPKNKGGGWQVETFGVGHET